MKCQTNSYTWSFTKYFEAKQQRQRWDCDAKQNWFDEIKSDINKYKVLWKLDIEDEVNKKGKQQIKCDV